MSSFICPVCGKELKPNNGNLSCENRHSFDIAKSGYVNLLLSQQPKAKHHGDDRLMVRSRRDFLDKGYYAPLLKSLAETVKKYAKNGCVILDAGCGECWYTAGIYDYLKKSETEPQMLGVDISKDALALGAKRGRELKLAVASVFNLPVGDEACDILLSVFAPYSGKEFGRVLAKDGVLIRVVPLEKHLWRLKEAVYDAPYENPAESSDLDGFRLLCKHEIRETIHISSNEDIVNVFTMTPYYYKTSAKDQKKLQNLTEIDTEIEFGILIYRKQSGEKGV
ncbi:MAG: methyltransferase domain-containing protein [Bacillota bacterium]|nr:methyltransferase domain-containing protein [Bacillota bacterium]